MNTERLNLAKDLREKKKPRFVAKNTNTKDPSHTRLCNNVGEPGATASTIEGASSKYTRLCTGGKKPAKAPSATEVAGPIHARLCANATKPSWEASTVEGNLSDVAHPNRKTRSSRHAALWSNNERSR